MRTSGIHHVTAICRDPQPNADFYAGVLGLRLVKRTVNFDDPTTYHLYYGDALGRPGTILTFFPWPGAPRGTRGVGQATAVAFAVPSGALDGWIERLAERAVEFDAMGLERRVAARERFRYEAPGGEPGAFVDVVCAPGLRRGRIAAGTIHHVAFRAASDADQAKWRARLAGAGMNVTPVMDRRYFRSIYFREPGGVLFEIATDPPGFALDERPEALGTGLMLPEWLEPRRAYIEERLPRLRLSDPRPVA